MSGYNNMSSPQFKQQQPQTAQMMPMSSMQPQQSQQPMYNKMNQFNNASKPMAMQQHQQQQQQASYGNFKPAGMPNGAPIPPNQSGYMSGGKPMAMQQQQQMQSTQQGQIHSGAGGPPGYGYNPNMKQLSSLPPHMQHPQQPQQVGGVPMMQPTQSQQQAQFNPQSPSNSNKMNLVGSPYQQQQQQIKPMASVTASSGGPGSNASTTGVPNANASSINVNVPGGYSTNPAASTLSPNRSMSQPPSTPAYYNTTQTTTYNTTPSGYATYTGSVMPQQGQQYVTGPGVYGSYGAPNGVYSTANTGYGMAPASSGMMNNEQMGHLTTPTVQSQPTATPTTPDSASTTPTKRGRGRAKKQSANSETSSPTTGDSEPQEGTKPKGKRGKKSNTTPEPSLSLSPGPLASSNNNTTGSSSMLYAPSVSSSTSMPPARPPSNSYANSMMSGPATSPSPNRATPVGNNVPQTSVYPGTVSGPAYPHHYPPGSTSQQQTAPYGTYTSNNTYPIAQNSQNVMNTTAGQINGSGMVYNTAPNANQSNTSMPYMIQQPTMMKPGIQTPIQAPTQASPVGSATSAGPQLTTPTVVKKTEETSPVGPAGVSPASASQTMYNSSNNSQPAMTGMSGQYVNNTNSINSSPASYPGQQATTPNYNSAPVAVSSSVTSNGSIGQSTMPSSTPGHSIMPASVSQSTVYTSSSTMSSQPSINHTQQPIQAMPTPSSQVSLLNSFDMNIFVKFYFFKDNSVKPAQTVVVSPYMSNQAPHMNNGNGQPIIHSPHQPMSAYSAYPNDNSKAQAHQMIPVVMTGPGAPPTAPPGAIVQPHGAYMMPPPMPPMSNMSMAPGQPIQNQQGPYMQHQTTLQTGESYNMGYPIQPQVPVSQQETTPVKKLTKKQLREMQQTGMEVDPDSATKKQRKIKPKQKSSADNSMVEGAAADGSNGPNNNAHIESTIDDLMKQYNIGSKKKTAGKKKKKIKDLDDEDDGDSGSESETGDDEGDADYNEDEDKSENQVEGEKVAKKRGPKRGQKKSKAVENDSFDEELAAMIEKSANEEEPRKKRKYTKKKAKDTGEDASELDNTVAAETPGDSSEQPVVQTPDLGDRFKRIVLSNTTSNSNRGRRKSTQNLIKLMKKKQRKKRKKTSSGEEDAEEDDDSDDFELNTLQANNKSSARKENENSGDASNTETGENGGDDAAMARELQDNNKRRSVRSAASKKTKFVTIKDEDLLMPVDPNEEEPAEQADTNIVVASQDNFIVDKILGVRLAKRKTMRKKEKLPKQPKVKPTAKEETTTEDTKEPVVENKQEPVEDTKMEVECDVKSPPVESTSQPEVKETSDKTQEPKLNGASENETKVDETTESETAIPKEINSQEEIKQQVEVKPTADDKTDETLPDQVSYFWIIYIREYNDEYSHANAE